MIHGVTILSDVLRPDKHGAPGGVDRLATWLHNALKRQITLASGLPVHLLTTSPILAAAIAACHRPGQADAFWAANYQSCSIADIVEPQLLSGLHDQFCIVYEMPPYLATLLDGHAIPYLDIRIHPVRFLDDLLFAVRSSEGSTQVALVDFAMSESEVFVTAGLREAMCQFIGQAAIPADTLLVLGQRRFDSTQIHQGVFYDAFEHRPDITAICTGYGGVLLKPHPLDREHSLLAVTAGVAGNILGVIDDNIYRLLSLPEITGVLSVSSSVAHEARYFAKTIHSLAPLPIQLAWRDEPVAPQQHVSLTDSMLSIDFWRAVLAPHARATRVDHVRLPPKPNRLRLSLDSFWTYNQIDTDRLPRA